MRNDVLRDAVVAYLELVRAERGEAIALQAVENTEKLATIIRQYSETGQGLQSDYQRMEADLSLRLEQVAVQQEAVQVASARLAQVLHADPSVRIVTAEPVVLPLDVMAIEDSPAPHIALGLSRPPRNFASKNTLSAKPSSGSIVKNTHHWCLASCSG